MPGFSSGSLVVRTVEWSPSFSPSFFWINLVVVGIGGLAPPAVS